MSSSSLAIEHVPYGAVVVGLDIDDADFVEQAPVRRLAAAFGVEGGAVEGDGGVGA
jgi:hypothetical protein